MKDIAEDQLQRTTLGAYHEIYAARVGCDLFLELPIDHQQNGGNGNAECQQKNIKRCVQRP
jgi:hypothetical protein